MRARLTLIPIAIALVFTLATQAPVDARVRENERARVRAIVKVLTTPPPPVTDPSTFAKPATGGIMSAFGRRGGRRHDGVDIDAPYGAPIVAAQSGTVTLAGWKNGYGQTVIINHGHGLSTLYAHESKLVVRAGQFVSQGQLIGYVGATGRVTAPHLHYEVHVNGVPRNPVAWL